MPVDRVHDMGAVLPSRSAHAQVQCGRDYGQTVVSAYRPRLNCGLRLGPICRECGTLSENTQH